MGRADRPADPEPVGRGRASSAGGADAEAFYEAYSSTLESYEAESDYESAMERCAERQ